MMFNNKDKILIIAAHPDDEVIGCGGAIIKAKLAKANVFVLFLGEGVSARFPGEELSKKSLLARKIREQEAQNCLKYLDVKKYKFYHFLCTKFDSYPIVDFVRIIEKIISDFKPSMIFTHHENELNIDHTIVSKATEIATRPYKNKFIKSIFAFETPCSGNFVFDNRFQPNVFLNINKEFKIKLNAFKKYKNEIKQYPFPRSLKGLEILARFRGLQSNLEFSEAYRLLRQFY